MTPAVRAATAAGVHHRLHEYDHDRRSSGYGQEAVDALSLDPERVFKTLVGRLAGGDLVVAVVPVSSRLDLKALARVFGASKAVMAEVAEAERSSGYVAGGISPLGQKRPLPTVVDVSAQGFDTIFVSAGRRGLEIELGPEDLRRLTGGCFAAVSRR